MWFTRRNKQRDRDLEAKMKQSQQVLLEAAIATANAAQDVTSTLKARLDDSVRQFESTARILNDPLFVCDMVGGIQACNPAAQTTFGFQSKLIGTSIMRLFARDGQPIAYASALWPLLANDSGCLPDAEAPLRGVRSDGSLLWIDPEVTRLDWSNKTTSMLVLIRDISEMVRLHEVDQRYRSILETSFDGILIVKNDKIVAANPSIKRLFGYDNTCLLEQPISLLLGEEHAHLADDRHFATTGRHVNGSDLNLIFTSTAISWNKKEAKLLTIRDVTDMRRLIEVSDHLTRK